MSTDEEVALAKRVERGDEQAKEVFITSNLRLVVSVARRHQGRGLPLPDLVQEGVLGLIRAVEKFDWRRGYKFSTYAIWWIRQTIQRGLARTAREIRMPLNLTAREARLLRAERELEQRLGRDPTDEELAHEAGLDPEQVREVNNGPRVTQSLDALLTEEGGLALSDVVSATTVGPSEEADARLMAHVVHDALQALPSAERTVLEHRYGINGTDGPRGLGKTSRSPDCSDERMDELEERGLARLAAHDELRSLHDAS